MGYKITHDYLAKSFENLADQSPAFRSKLGKTTKDYAGGRTFYRALDDDRNPLYTAMCDDDDDSAERFLAWAEWDSGATILQGRTEAGTWEDVIS